MYLLSIVGAILALLFFFIVLLPLALEVVVLFFSIFIEIVSLFCEIILGIGSFLFGLVFEILGFFIELVIEGCVLLLDLSVEICLGLGGLSGRLRAYYREHPQIALTSALIGLLPLLAIIAGILHVLGVEPQQFLPFPPR